MTQTCILPTTCKACKGDMVKGACRNEQCIWYSTLCKSCGFATDDDAADVCETCWDRHHDK